MAWCSPTDTAAALPGDRDAYGRESSTTGRGVCRGVCGAGLEQMSALAVCRFCGASFTAAAARRATGGGRAVAGAGVPCRGVPLTGSRSRPTAASGQACRRPARPAAPRHQRIPAGWGTASVQAASAAVRSSLIGVAVVDERQHRRGDIEAVLDPHKRSSSTPAKPTRASPVAAELYPAHRFQRRVVANGLPPAAGGVALTLPHRAAHRRHRRPHRRWTPPRAASLTASGQNRWPPAGNHPAASRQYLTAAHSS